MATKKRAAVAAPEAAPEDAGPPVAAAVAVEAAPLEAPVAAEPKRKAPAKRKKKAPVAEAAEELVPAPELVAAPAAPSDAGAWPEGPEEWLEDVEAAYLQSKYTLVSVAAKRARQILGGSKRRVDSLSEKPVTVALEELGQGKLYFERTRDGTK